MKLIVLLVLFGALVVAASPAPVENVFTPDKIPYGPVPAFVPPGAQLAVLEGDPTASTGDFRFGSRCRTAIAFRHAGTRSART